MTAPLTMLCDLCETVPADARITAARCDLCAGCACTLLREAFARDPDLFQEMLGERERRVVTAGGFVERAARFTELVSLLEVAAGVRAVRAQG